MTEMPEPSNGIFATFNEDGQPTGFYFELVHGPRFKPVRRAIISDDIRVFPTIVYDMAENPDCKIPPEAVPITREEHRRLYTIEG